MAWVPIAMAAVSMISSMAGAQKTAQAQAASANYQGQVARNNAVVSEQMAQASEQRGRVNAQVQQMKTAQMIGAQRAAMGANGVDLTEGSPLNVQTDTARVGALDTATIIHNAALDAYGYRAQGTSYIAQAGLDDATAGNAKTAGDINVISSFASGASQVSSNWAKWQQTGVVK